MVVFCTCEVFKVDSFIEVSYYVVEDVLKGDVFFGAV